VSAPRLLSPEARAGDALDRALRPTGFDQFVGQASAKANLQPG
jgi:Holliday junction resolvasome RuvABC ATP-dependent DNA helicase subunit